MRGREERELHKGHRQFILLLLSHGPLNREGFLYKTQRMGYHFSMPLSMLKKMEDDRGYQEEIEDDLRFLTGGGYIVDDGSGCFSLTEKGNEEALRLDRGMIHAFKWIDTYVFNREWTSKVSVLVNALLAALKLGVGFIFNSIALVADGFDSTIDVLSAVMVYLGIRYRRELYSTVFIICMMFGTTGFILYEGIRRLIVPEPVDAAVLTIVAAVVSGGICYVMSVYQHFVGKRSGSISLISQSVDSRNHAFQAAAVIVGLIFALFGIYIVDSLVALLVAVLIGKSAVELTIETVRMAGGGELDVSRFSREYEKVLANRRHNFLKTWLMLTLRDAHSRDEIISRCESAFATQDLPVVGHLSSLSGFDFFNYDFKGQLDSLLRELIDEGLIRMSDESYYLTPGGQRALGGKIARERFRISR
jgi:cation diffusion facilitator family transporter